MATQVVKTRLSHSPTILQYHKPRTVDRPFYKRQAAPRKFHPTDEIKETLRASWLHRTDPLMPIYPYGKNVTFPDANDGLYGGATIQSGHKIAKGRNKGKTMRKWYPNVRAETLHSDSLDRDMTLPVAARVMRTIKKCGGLDQYVMGDKPARVKELGLLGWKLRWLVMNSPSMKAKLAEERMKLGLPPQQQEQLEQNAAHNDNLSFEQVWADPEQRAALLQKLDLTWEQLREKDERFKKHVKETLRWEDDIPEMITLRNHKPSSVA